ncbi:MAG TPA: hypothetical protein VLE95_01065 [Chlamydiales bacterium]|nr:hypothetical protein [Chlamydiales bacterium]
MKKIFCLFLVFAASYASADHWNQFHTKNKECSISFPEQPTLFQQSLKVASGEHLHYDIYLAPFQNKGIFMLLVATYPHPLTGGHEVAGLEGLLKGIVGHNPENKLIFAELVTHEGKPAMTFLVQSVSNYFRGQALMSENKLFLIAMEGRKTELDESMFGKFLESFQISH